MRHLLISTLLFALASLTKAQSGKLNSSFGSDGKVLTEFLPRSNFREQGHQIIQQADGKLLVVFSNNSGKAVSRYLPNGELDKSFGNSGYTVTVGSGFVFREAVSLPDGSIILAGTLNSDFALFRFGNDGLLDKNFGSNGFVAIDFGSNEMLTSIKVTSDNKLVILGSTINGNVSDLALVKLNSNGKFYNKFGKRGKLVMHLTDEAYSLTSMAIQPDEKIVVGGSIATGNINQGLLFRLNKNGEADNGFGINGLALLSSNAIVSIAFQPNGQIILIDNLSLLRVTQNGISDETFGTGGKQQIYSTSNPVAVVVQDDSRILICGTFVFGTVVTKYDENGSLDLTYGNNTGRAIVMPIRSTYPSSMILQTDGKVVITGYNSPFASGVQYYVLRLNENGLLDNGFQQKGLGLFGAHYVSNSSVFHAVAVQKDGKIVAAGRAEGSQYSTLVGARYFPDGSLDSSFANNGKLIYTNIGAAFGNVSIGVKSSNAIVISNQKYLLGFDSDGSPDSSFGQNGQTLTNIIIGSLKVLSNDKILILGNLENGARVLASYNSNGTIDASFGNNGMVSIDVPLHFNNSRPPIAIQSDGKILLSGSVYSNGKFQQYIIRLTDKGSLDKNFDGDGKAQVDSSLPDFEIFSLSIQDGKIIVAGSADINGVKGFAVMRLNKNGSIDNTFGVNGFGYANFSYQSSLAASTILKNGDIMLVGTVQSDIGLARFKSQGQLDKSFGTNGMMTTDIALTNETANGIAVNEKQLYVCGQSSALPQLTSLIVAYNLQGRTDNKSERLKEDVITNTAELKIAVLSNPSTNYFKINISSNIVAPIHLRVTDASGKVVKQQNVTGRPTIEFGNDYRPGIYLAEIMQGTQKEIVKLIKQ